MRAILALCVPALLLGVSLTNADLRVPRRLDASEKILSRTIRTYPGLFKPNERASAQLYGNGRSSLLMYVFDADGNCVAWDDNITRPYFCDELGVEWIADASGRHSVEVHNVGLEEHEYTLAIR